MNVSFSLVCLSVAFYSTIVSAMTTPVKPKILSFGIAAVDFIAVVDHFPEPDEKMRSSSLWIAGGGNAANSACAIGRLSEYASVDCATAVGNDANGNTIIDGLEENGVGTKFIERFEGNSPFSYILTTPDNARTIIHQPSSRDMTKKFADKNIPLKDYFAIHFDCRHPEAAVHLSKKCVKAGIPYSLDVERPREGLEDLMKNAKVVICNSNYCNIVLGEPEGDLTNEEIADRLKQVIQKQAPNAEIALQTLGSKGSCLVRMKGENDEKGEILKDKNAPLVTCHDDALWCEVWKDAGDIVDSTGAGDAFQGGFVTALWSYLANCGDDGTSLEEMPTKALAHTMRVATRVAAMKLTKLGARDGLPYSSKDKPLQKEFDGLLASVKEKA